MLRGPKGMDGMLMMSLIIEGMVLPDLKGKYALYQFIANKSRMSIYVSHVQSLSEIPT
jgi:hypothetical protein